MDRTWDLREERAVDAGFWPDHLSEWGRRSPLGEGKCKGSLWNLSPLWWPTLFSVVDLPFTVGAALRAPVLGDLQFRAPWSRSSVMLQGGPTRKCEHGHLFTSWSKLVAVADSLDLRGPKRRASPSFRTGELFSVLPSTLSVNLLCCSGASDYQLAFNFAKIS